MSEKSYDVVVVGAGNAALTAAISAKENVGSVLVIEKAPKRKRGGNSFFTDGAIRFAYGDKEKLSAVIPELKNDVENTIRLPNYGVEEYLSDLKEVTKNQIDPELGSQLAEKSFETILWLNKQGVQFKLNDNQMFEKDGIKQFWGGLPVKTHRKGIGLVETLLMKAEELGIDIMYEAAGKRLDMVDGKVNGIYVDNEGEERLIKTPAVVIAAGGFEANKKMRMEYIGDQWENAVVRGTEYNTGDGIKMALEAGAKKSGQWDGCHAHTTDYNAPRVGDFEKPGDIYKKSSYPLGIIVNKNGERFVDEGADFRNYTYAKYGKETLKQPNQLAYQMFDAQVVDLLRKEYKLEEATCIKADTFEEFASKLDIDKEKFLKTIEEYNSAVQEGNYDPSIKDGKGTEGITPPKSNWALRFEEGPFYAYPVTCGITFTFGGICVTKEGKVISESGEVIPGLFAAGEMIGGLYYENYPGGSGLMSGAVFGRLAGKSASEYVLAKLSNQK